MSKGSHDSSMNSMNGASGANGVNGLGSANVEISKEYTDAPQALMGELNRISSLIRSKKIKTFNNIGVGTTFYYRESDDEG